jgi:hypothetical protein
VRAISGLETVIPRSELKVAVRQYGPTTFCWELLRRPSGGGLAESIALSSERFRDYDQALDAGFSALHALCS